MGFGCAGAWAKRWYSADQADAIVRAAFDAGIRHFDTAGFYAGGEGERRLGRLLKDFREPAFVSTKVGTRYRGLLSPAKEFSPAAIRTAVEESLGRLGVDCLDLVYLHGPSSRELLDGVGALERLKDEGKLARIGVCGAGNGLDEATRAPGVDVIMGVYNLFHREHDGVFRRARESGLGVVAIAPLAQGLYKKDFFLPRTLPDIWHLARAVAKNRTELTKSRASLETLRAFEGWTPAQLMLSFVHAHPAIDVAVTTTTRKNHLDEIVLAAKRQAPSGLVETLLAETMATPRLA